MNTSIKGYGEGVVTFSADSTVNVGAAVKINGNNSVTACETGDDFIGVCIGLRDSYAAVQVGGYAEFKTTGNTPIGYKGIRALNEEIVGVDDDGKKYWIVYSSGNTIGIIL
jgi:hypothetical protein